jgi:inorganic pyrophosphatase/exopolyphosphatase
MILIYSANPYKIIIVDHNQIENSQKKLLERNLIEIIDHHKDNIVLYNDNIDNNNQQNIIKKSLIYPLGSCSTLVILEFLLQIKKDLQDNNYYNNNNNNNIINNNKSILNALFNENLLFLISAILLDTSNFTEEGFNSRWTSLDKIAYEEIKNLNEKYMSNKFSNEDAKIFYEKLYNIKFDENANLSLGVPKLFNKDKKEFSYNNIYKIVWSSLQVNLDLINENFSEKFVEEFIQNNIKDNLIWVFKYNKIENEKNFSFIKIYFNSNNDSNSKFTYNFIKEFNKYLLSQSEIKDLIYSYNEIDNKILIKLNESITRKNFEPFFKKYFEQIK